MPHHLRFGTEDLLRCRFAVSPLCETLEAVRTLRRTDRHSYHLPWLRRIHGAVADLDLTPLWLLMPLRSGYTPDFLGPPPAGTGVARGGRPVHIGEELEQVRRTDPALVHTEITRSLASTPGAAESARGRAMLDDPARTVRELADLAESAWEALLAPDWPRLRDLLEADIAHRSRQLAEAGLERMFADLHPRLSWSDGTLSVRTRYRGLEVQDLNGRGVLLMPSVFIWPDVVSGFAPPWQPSVIYPARGVGGLWQRPTADSAQGLARLLGANRAAVLRELDEPASTSALAVRLALAPSSVSAHLTALRDAGLLTSRRAGHQVLYERTPLGIALLAGNAGQSGLSAQSAQSRRSAESAESEESARSAN
jgi:DNA-binding transcriptional ArsR family regulator